METNSRGRTIADQISISGVSVKCVLDASDTGDSKLTAKHFGGCLKWRMIEALLRDVLSGSGRLASGDARLNLALADAVERHATKDPETRGILKRSSVVCHRESEPRKKIAAHSRIRHPHPSVTY